MRHGQKLQQTGVPSASTNRTFATVRILRSIRDARNLGEATQHAAHGTTLANDIDAYLNFSCSRATGGGVPTRGRAKEWHIC